MCASPDVNTCALIMFPVQRSLSVNVEYTYNFYHHTIRERRTSFVYHMQDEYDQLVTQLFPKNTAFIQTKLRKALSHLYLLNIVPLTQKL